jgi:pimeloyl-ACP methyl ester carboxylesterase
MLVTHGPTEEALLAELAPIFRERMVAQGEGALRVLEGGEGAPLVLLHGRGSAATTWFPLLTGLARDHRVLAVDLPGFGASHGHRFRGGGFEAALAYFVDPIEAWLVAEQVTSPVLVGHSLGGFVAVELALRRRVAPAALVLIAPLGVGAEVTAGARLFFYAGPERVARLLGPKAFKNLLPFRGPDATRQVALAYELLAVPGGRPDAAAAFDTLAPLSGPAPNRRAQLSGIEAPTVVVSGDHDEALPAPLAIGAAAALPRAELCMVSAGHAPHLEDPQGFLDAARLTSKNGT